MAKSTSHSRSSSFPSATHPIVASVEDNLQRIKSSEGTSTCPYSSVHQKLDGLRHLYECVDDLLHLSLGQQVLSHEKNGKLVDDFSDKSLRLLDLCGNIRDAFSQMRTSVQELEMSLRRKRSGVLSLNSEIASYMNARKKLNKMIRNSLKDLKISENSMLESVENELFPLFSLLGDVQEISLSVFKSMRLFCLPKTGLKPNGWSLVSKLLHSKRKSQNGEEDKTEMQMIGMELCLLKNKKSSKEVEIQNVLKHVEALELSFQELEEGLQAVFRLMLKTRVSFLNSLSN